MSQHEAKAGNLSEWAVPRGFGELPSLNRPKHDHHASTQKQVLKGHLRHNLVYARIRADIRTYTWLLFVVLKRNPKTQPHVVCFLLLIKKKGENLFWVSLKQSKLLCLGLAPKLPRVSAKFRATAHATHPRHAGLESGSRGELLWV